MAEVTPGVASLGTIVDAPPSTPVGYSISVAGLEHHYTGADLDRTVAKVMATAADISRRLKD
jgi:DNA-binding IclR family transcriptional regulator